MENWCGCCLLAREREKREEVFKFCLAEVNGENESLRPDVLLLK
jgi:hypothetical protein